VDKVGLLELDSNALYGALLSLRDGADDTAQVEKWSALGGHLPARGPRPDEGREPMLLTFAHMGGLTPGQFNRTQYLLWRAWTMAAIRAKTSQ